MNLTEGNRDRISECLFKNHGKNPNFEALIDAIVDYYISLPEAKVEFSDVSLLTNTQETDLLSVEHLANAAIDEQGKLTEETKKNILQSVSSQYFKESTWNSNFLSKAEFVSAAREIFNLSGEQPGGRRSLEELKDLWGENGQGLTNIHGFGFQLEEAYKENPKTIVDFIVSDVNPDSFNPLIVVIASSKDEETRVKFLDAVMTKIANSNGFFDGDPEYVSAYRTCFNQVGSKPIGSYSPKALSVLWDTDGKEIGNIEGFVFQLGQAYKSDPHSSDVIALLNQVRSIPTDSITKRFVNMMLADNQSNSQSYIPAIKFLVAAIENINTEDLKQLDAKLSEVGFSKESFVNTLMARGDLRVGEKSAYLFLMDKFATFEDKVFYNSLFKNFEKHIESWKSQFPPIQLSVLIKEIYSSQHFDAKILNERYQKIKGSSEKSNIEKRAIIGVFVSKGIDLSDEMLQFALRDENLGFANIIAHKEVPAKYRLNIVQKINFLSKQYKSEEATRVFIEALYSIAEEVNENEVEIIFGIFEVTYDLTQKGTEKIPRILDNDKLRDILEKKYPKLYRKISVQEIINIGVSIRELAKQDKLTIYQISGLFYAYKNIDKRVLEELLKKPTLISKNFDNEISVRLEVFRAFLCKANDDDVKRIGEKLNEYHLTPDEVLNTQSNYTVENGFSESQIKMLDESLFNQLKTMEHKEEIIPHVEKVFVDIEKFKKSSPDLKEAIEEKTNDEKLQEFTEVALGDINSHELKNMLEKSTEEDAIEYRLKILNIILDKEPIRSEIIREIINNLSRYSLSIDIGKIFENINFEQAYKVFDSIESSEFKMEGAKLILKNPDFIQKSSNEELQMLIKSAGIINASVSCRSQTDEVAKLKLATAIILGENIHEMPINIDRDTQAFAILSIRPMVLFERDPFLDDSKEGFYHSGKFSEVVPFMRARALGGWLLDLKITGRQLLDIYVKAKFEGKSIATDIVNAIKINTDLGENVFVDIHAADNAFEHELCIDLLKSKYNTSNYIRNPESIKSYLQYGKLSEQELDEILESCSDKVKEVIVDNIMQYDSKFYTEETVPFRLKWLQKHISSTESLKPGEKQEKALSDLARYVNSYKKIAGQKLFLPILENIFSQKFLETYPGFMNLLDRDILRQFINHCVSHPDEKWAQTALDNIVNFACSDAAISHSDLINDLREMMTASFSQRYASKLIGNIPQEATSQEYVNYAVQVGRALQDPVSVSKLQYGEFVSARKNYEQASRLLMRHEYLELNKKKSILEGKLNVAEDQLDQIQKTSSVQQQAVEMHVINEADKLEKAEIEIQEIKEDIRFIDKKIEDTEKYQTSSLSRIALIYLKQRLDNGCDVYLISSLPENTEELEAYKKSNANKFIIQTSHQKLSYINSRGEIEDITINNFNQFLSDIDIEKLNEEKVKEIHWSSKQFEEIVTKNGGRALGNHEGDFPTIFKNVSESEIEIIKENVNAILIKFKTEEIESKEIEKKSFGIWDSMLEWVYDLAVDKKPVGDIERSLRPYHEQIIRHLLSAYEDNAVTAEIKMPVGVIEEEEVAYDAQGQKLGVLRNAQVVFVPSTEEEFKKFDEYKAMRIKVENERYQNELAEKVGQDEGLVNSKPAHEKNLDEINLLISIPSVQIGIVKVGTDLYDKDKKYVGTLNASGGIDPEILLDAESSQSLLLNAETFNKIGEKNYHRLFNRIIYLKHLPNFLTAAALDNLVLQRFVHYLKNDCPTMLNSEDWKSVVYWMDSSDLKSIFDAYCAKKQFGNAQDVLFAILSNDYQAKIFTSIEKQPELLEILLKSELEIQKIERWLTPPCLIQNKAQDILRAFLLSDKLYPNLKQDQKNKYIASISVGESLSAAIVQKLHKDVRKKILREGRFDHSHYKNLIHDFNVQEKQDAIKAFIKSLDHQEAVRFMLTALNQKDKQVPEANSVFDKMVETFNMMVNWVKELITGDKNLSYKADILQAVLERPKCVTYLAGLLDVPDVKPAITIGNPKSADDKQLAQSVFPELMNTLGGISSSKPSYLKNIFKSLGNAGKNNVSVSRVKSVKELGLILKKGHTEAKRADEKKNQKSPGDGKGPLTSSQKDISKAALVEAEAGPEPWTKMVLRWFGFGKNTYLAEKEETKSEKIARKKAKQPSVKNQSSTIDSHQNTLQANSFLKLVSKPRVIETSLLSNKSLQLYEMAVVERLQVGIKSYFNLADGMADKRESIAIHEKEQIVSFRERNKGKNQVEMSEYKALMIEIKKGREKAKEIEKRIVLADYVKQASASGNPFQKLLHKEMNEKGFDPELDVLATEYLIVIADIIKNCGDPEEKKIISKFFGADLGKLEERIAKSMQKRVDMLENGEKKHSDLLFDLFDAIKPQMEKNKLPVLSAPLEASREELEKMFNTQLIDENSGKQKPESYIFKNNKEPKDYMKKYVDDYRNKANVMPQAEKSPKIQSIAQKQDNKTAPQNRGVYTKK